MPHSPAPIVTRAFPRVGFLGNPSDGYGGRVLAFTFRDFEARVELRARSGSGSDLDIAGAVGRFDELVGRMRSLEGAAGLLVAALNQFVRAAADCGCDDVVHRMLHAPFQMRFESTIPRQVGMAGSSAIVLAGLRALCARFGVGWSASDRARLAYLAETEDLGVAAGPQDRVVQSFGGVWLMDFAGAWSDYRYRRLPSRRLPPVFVAWDPNGGDSSGIAHGALRAKASRDDAAFGEAVARWRELAGLGYQACWEGDLDTVRAVMDENFDLRARVQPLSDRDRDLVSIGRGQGAAVKLCGSGGAVVGLAADPGRNPAIEQSYRDAGYDWLMPDARQPVSLDARAPTDASSSPPGGAPRA